MGKGRDTSLGHPNVASHDTRGVTGRVWGPALLPSLSVHIENLSEDLKPSQHFPFWQQNSDYCSRNLKFPSPGSGEGAEVVGNLLDVTEAPRVGCSGDHRDGNSGAGADVQTLSGIFLSKPEKGFDPELFFWRPGTFLFFAFVLHKQQKVPDRRKMRRCLWLWWGAGLGLSQPRAALGVPCALLALFCWDRTRDTSIARAVGAEPVWAQSRARSRGGWHRMWLSSAGCWGHREVAPGGSAGGDSSCVTPGGKGHREGLWADLSCPHRAGQRAIPAPPRSPGEERVLRGL